MFGCKRYLPLVFGQGLRAVRILWADHAGNQKHRSPDGQTGPADKWQADKYARDAAQRQQDAAKGEVVSGLFAHAPDVRSRLSSC